jgi:hypothetical protein
MRSEVDENLFGQPNRVVQAQALRDAKSSKIKNKGFIHFFINFSTSFFKGSNVDLRKSTETSPERNKKPQSKEYIKHITKDLIREILSVQF